MHYKCFLALTLHNMNFIEFLNDDMARRDDDDPNYDTIFWNFLIRYALEKFTQELLLFYIY